MGISGCAGQGWRSLWGCLFSRQCVCARLVGVRVQVERRITIEEAHRHQFEPQHHAWLDREILKPGYVVQPEGVPDHQILFRNGSFLLDPGGDPIGTVAVEFARTVTAKGAGEILLTSMDRDGTRAGFNLPLTRAISDAVSVPVIASGGVGTLDHLVEGVTKGGASAVLAASIFHFGDFTIAQAKTHMAAAGIPMRLT